MEMAEREELYKDKEWLEEQYWIEEKSQSEIANILRMPRPTLQYWFVKFGIPQRSHTTAAFLKFANHIILSQEAKEFIDGELLGDMSMGSRLGQSPKITYSSKFEKYLQWLSMQLSNHGIKQSGKIDEHKVYKIGEYQYVDPLIAWDYRSCSYFEFFDIYKRWYPQGKKIVPLDIELSPIVCRQWYIGDGSLINASRNSYIILCTDCFLVREVELLIKKLIELNFNAVRQPARNRITIDTQTTPSFLKYIGPCPKEIEEYYGYKWRKN